MLVMLFTVLCGIGLKNAGFDNNYKSYFNNNNPQMQAFNRLETQFANYENILLVFTPKGDLFSRENLAALSELTKGAWQIPDSVRVDSITNYQYSYATDDDLVVEDLFTEYASLLDSQLAKRKDFALNEPDLVNLLVAKDGKAAGVNVATVVNPSDPISGYTAVNATRDLARTIEQKYPGVKIHITGNITLTNAFLESTIEDFTTIMPLMYTLLIVMSWLVLRSFYATMITMTVVMLASTIGLGIPAWFGVQLTTPSAIAPNIIMTLAIADSIHILMAYIKARNTGMENTPAIHQAINKTIRPVVLTSVTTAIGFLSMNFSESPPFNDLGNITAVGVMAALLLTFTLIPAALSIKPVKQGNDAFKAAFMGAIADFVVTHKTKLLVVFPIFALALSAMSAKIELNDSYVDFFDQSIEFRQATEYAEQNLTGIYRVDFALFAKGKEQVTDPQYLREVEKFAKWLEAQPEVMHVSRLPTRLMRINQNMHQDEPAHYSLYDDQQTNAQYLLLYEMSLPYGLDSSNQVSMDKSASKVTATLYNVKAKTLRAFEQKAYGWMHDNLPSYMRPVAGSANLMFAHISLHNIKSMTIGTVLALVLISLILVFFLKNVRFGLVSIIPNILPAAMAFGVWGLLVGEVGMVASTISALTLGIVVDDSIHFISSFLRGIKEEGMTPEQAVRATFERVGPALLANTVILTVGFLVLALSPFELNAVMGLLSAITIAIALIADFIFLPPLLLWVAGKQQSVTQRDNRPLSNLG